MSASLILVAGARPNFMKVAPVLRALAGRDHVPAPTLVHTGQHYDEGMSDVFFRQLGIPQPTVHLGVGSGPHGAQTARIMASFEEHVVALTPRPMGVVVVGDVNSTMACALAAVKVGIPVAHVEAGLRSFDRTMPEEINRLVTDTVADLLLVSEPAGEENLRREGIPPQRIRYTGNVMIDTLVRELAAARALDMAASRGLSPGGYAYVTLHRPSNVDSPARLEALVGFLEAVARRLPVVFPAHPRTAERLRAAGLAARLESTPHVWLSPPLGYRESLGLMAGACLAITDSGGVQEETTFLGIPCLTLRANTERPVTVSSGTNTVVGSDLALAERLVDDILGGRYKRGQAIRGWDGHAADRVVDAILEAWGQV
jgi:UDP-N-acetylglucosamine 2-epimerase (non-hydrolysing)